MGMDEKNLNKFQYMYKKVSSSLCSSINNFIRDKERDGMPYTVDDIRRYMERGFNVMKSKYSFVTDEMLDKCISFVVKELDDREGLYFLKNNKMNENNMKRKAIKINESDLHRMIKRSVSRILNEIYKSEEPELYYILHGDEFIDDLMSEEEYENAASKDPILSKIYGTEYRLTAEVFADDDGYIYKWNIVEDEGLQDDLKQIKDPGVRNLLWRGWQTFMKHLDINDFENDEEGRRDYANSEMGEPDFDW